MDTSFERLLGSRQERGHEAIMKETSAVNPTKLEDSVWGMEGGMKWCFGREACSPWRRRIVLCTRRRAMRLSLARIRTQLRAKQGALDRLSGPSQP